MARTHQVMKLYDQSAIEARKETLIEMIIGKIDLADYNAVIETLQAAAEEAKEKGKIPLNDETVKKRIEDAINKMYRAIYLPRLQNFFISNTVADGRRGDNLREDYECYVKQIRDALDAYNAGNEIKSFEPNTRIYEEWIITGLESRT
jgi:hypothetical protein